MLRVAALIVVLGGCGRIGFDPFGDGGGSSGGDDASGTSDGNGSAGTPPALVQTKESFSASTAGIAVVVPQPLVVGDLIILSVGFKDATTSIIGTLDSAGNILSQNSQLQRGTGLSQELFWGFATKAANMNTLSVTLTVAAPNVSLRLLVYRNVGAAVQDYTNSASGTAASVVITTANAGDIIVGTDTAGQPASSAAAGYTTLMTTNYGDLVIDRTVGAVGMQTASVNLVSLAPYVMQAIVLPHQ